MTIYQIESPFWLSDRFIFGEIAEIGICYIKINCDYQIEEIGVDIENRMYKTPIDKIISQSKVATVKQRHLFTSIGVEYWSAVLNNQRRLLNSHIYIENNCGKIII